MTYSFSLCAIYSWLNVCCQCLKHNLGCKKILLQALKMPSYLDSFFHRISLKTILMRVSNNLFSSKFSFSHVVGHEGGRFEKHAESAPYTSWDMSEEFQIYRKPRKLTWRHRIKSDNELSITENREIKTSYLNLITPPVWSSIALLGCSSLGKFNTNPFGHKIKDKTTGLHQTLGPFILLQWIRFWLPRSFQWPFWASYPFFWVVLL